MAIDIVHFGVEMDGVDRLPSFVPDETDVVMVVMRKRVECVVRLNIQFKSLRTSPLQIVYVFRLSRSSLQ